MEFFFQQLLNGLAVGGIYALVALGYTMVYGVLKLINFAHGDLFAIGAYLGLTLLVSCNLAGILSPLPAVLLVCVMVAVLVAIIGYLLERVIEVRSGLEGGETVILSPSDELENGAKLEVQP